MGSVGSNKGASGKGSTQGRERDVIAEINQGFKSVADSDMPIEKAYFDISNEFADKVFNTYDPSDLYGYLTQKEQKSAYKDMQWKNVPKQIEYEWKKKAIWRIAKKKAWNELEVWE